MRTFLPAASLLAATLFLSVATPVRADETQNRNLAAQLFRTGRDDMAAGNWDAAAAKLQESHRLVPAMGTLLNLAVCQEHTGKTASAYQNFTEVIQEAKTSGRTDRLDLANAEVAKLVPLLADVTVHIATNVKNLPHLAVTIDGAPLPATLFETKVNYDPGTHKIEANADGKKPWSQQFNVEASSHSELAIPMLADKPYDPNERTVSVAEAEREQKRSAVRTAGLVLMGVGGAGVVTSLVFGALAIHDKSKISSSCSRTNCGLADANESASANRLATVANVTFGAGLGLAAVGAVIVFIERKPSGPEVPEDDNPEALRVAPSFDAHGAGLTLARAW